MTGRTLVVKGRGEDGRVTFFVEIYRGKVWVTSFDRLFTCEAILEPAQADSLVTLIRQATTQARGYQNNPAS